MVFGATHKATAVSDLDCKERVHPFLKPQSAIEYFPELKPQGTVQYAIDGTLNLKPN